MFQRRHCANVFTTHDDVRGNCLSLFWRFMQLYKLIQFYFLYHHLNAFVSINHSSWKVKTREEAQALISCCIYSYFLILLHFQLMYGHHVHVYVVLKRREHEIYSNHTDLPTTITASIHNFPRCIQNIEINRWQIKYNSFVTVERNIQLEI